ncbi:accessory factor UbiK family protein [Burkholderiaceae bacterium DAT-1]|nr:accessory factor UbiK family protein [Burkholderiaceae bacterium DAT-1]
MLSHKLLDEMHQKFSEALAASPAKDIEKNAKAALSAALSKLDLVTREEFDIQSAVLAKTREKLADLEARIAKLEAAATAKASDPQDGI